MKNKIAVALCVCVACLCISGSALADGNGRYLKHNYTYTQKDKIIAATFKPFLPRDDTILIGAMLELVNNVYGKHQIKDLKPNIVKRNGQNLIRFQGVGYDYIFLIIKQDSGEVNGLSMWRERA
jgi:hypothetical protein